MCLWKWRQQWWNQRTLNLCSVQMWWSISIFSVWTIHPSYISTHVCAESPFLQGGGRVRPGQATSPLEGHTHSHWFTPKGKFRIALWRRFLNCGKSQRPSTDAWTKKANSRQKRVSGFERGPFDCANQHSTAHPSEPMTQDFNYIFGSLYSWPNTFRQIKGSETKNNPIALSQYLYFDTFSFGFASVSGELSAQAHA